MKKILFGLVAAAGMLFATSCAKDVDAGIPEGGIAPVTFNVGLENVISTRAISDGTTADKLFYAIYTSDGSIVAQSEEEEINDLKAQFTVSLVAGESYSAIFWAQNSECTAYSVNYENKSVTVDYAGAVNNDETRDAFFGTAEFTVGTETAAGVSATLKRPFAQINYGVKAAEGSKVPAVAKSSLTVSGAYNTLSLVDSAVTGAEAAAVEFAAAEVPADALTVGEESYTYQSMSYVLVAGNVDLAFSFDGGEAVTVENAPVKMNYRTNVLAIVTGTDVEFNVEITPGYEGDLPEDEDPDQPEEPATFTVSDVKAEYAEGVVTFSAKFEGDKEAIESAYFVYAPVVRAAEGGKVEAVVGDGTLTATTAVEAGTYTVTVEINGEVVEAEDAEDVELNVPEAEEPEDGNVYKLVTSNQTNWAGEYVIGWANGTKLYTLNEKYSGETATRSTFTYEIMDGEYDGTSINGTFKTVTIEAVGNNYYAIKYGSMYVGWTSSTNNSCEFTANTPTESDTEYLWTLFVSNGTTLVTNVGAPDRRLQFNSNEGQERFAIYKGTQNDLLLFTTNPEITEPDTPVDPTPGEGTAVYKKITTDSELESGVYLIVCENDSLIFNGGLSKLDAEGNKVDVTITEGTIEANDTTNACSFTYDAAAGSFKSASGFYIGTTSDANSLLSSAYTVYTNTVSIDENGDAQILGASNQGNPRLRYNNAASNGTRFRFYKSSSYQNQQPIQLYKKVTE